MITAALKNLARRLLADELRTHLEAQGRLQKSIGDLASAADEVNARLRAAERRVRTQGVILTEIRDALDEAKVAPGDDLGLRVRALAAAQGGGLCGCGCGLPALWATPACRQRGAA